MILAGLIPLTSTLPVYMNRRRRVRVPLSTSLISIGELCRDITFIMTWLLVATMDL